MTPARTPCRWWRWARRSVLALSKGAAPTQLMIAYFLARRKGRTKSRGYSRRRHWTRSNQSSSPSRSSVSVCSHRWQRLRYQAPSGARVSQFSHCSWGPRAHPRIDWISHHLGKPRYSRLHQYPLRRSLNIPAWILYTSVWISCATSKQPWLPSCTCRLAGGCTAGSPVASSAFTHAAQNSSTNHSYLSLTNQQPKRMQPTNVYTPSRQLQELLDAGDLTRAAWIVRRLEF